MESSDESLQAGRSEVLASVEAKRYLETNAFPKKREDPSARDERAQKRSKSRFQTGAVAISRAVAGYLDQQTSGVSKKDAVNALSCLYTSRRVGDVLNTLYGAGVITSPKEDIRFILRRRTTDTDEFLPSIVNFLPMPEFVNLEDSLDAMFDTRSDI